MGLKAFQFSCAGTGRSEEIENFAKQIPQKVGGPSSLGILFITSKWLPQIDELCDILRIHGQIVDVVGATGREIETAAGLPPTHLNQGLVLLTLAAEQAKVTTATIQSEHAEPAQTLARKGGILLVMFDPYHFNIESWLNRLNEKFPDLPCMGGLASGPSSDGTAVFLNGQVIPGGVAVNWQAPGIEVETVVSQGCRPIGEPLTVTKAEKNIIYSLGGQPAYHVLDRAFQTLSQEEKNRAPGNLFAGLATTEYVDEFYPGDFLIRHIIGADPASGAVVLAGAARIGQTLQYQFRDRASAEEDLLRVLQNTAHRRPHPPQAAILFRCLARSAGFFGAPCFDISQFQRALGPHPAIGLACNGEIGPLHGVSSLTGYTAAAALLYDQNPQ